MKRKDIMKSCPEEFESELEDFINEIESDVNTIKDLLDIKGLNDLVGIEEAFENTKELSSKLY